jgi:tetratricopeptide (TPR) repeat protein
VGSPPEKLIGDPDSSGPTSAPGTSLADRVDALLFEDELDDGDGGPSGGLIDDEAVVIAEEDEASVEMVAEDPAPAPQRALDLAIEAAEAAVSDPSVDASVDASADGSGIVAEVVEGSVNLSADIAIEAADVAALDATDEPPARPSSTSVATAPAASSAGDDDELSFSLVDQDAPNAPLRAPAAPRTITATAVSSSPAPAVDSDGDDEEIAELSEISEISEIVTINRSSAPPRAVPPAPPPRLPPSMPPRPVRSVVTVPPRNAPPSAPPLAVPVSSASGPPSAAAAAAPSSVVSPMPTAPGHPPPAPSRAGRPGSTPPAPPGSSPLTSSAVVVTPRAGDPLDALEAKLSAWEGREEDAVVEEAELSEISSENLEAEASGASDATGLAARAPTADPGDSATGQPAMRAEGARELRSSGQLPVMPPPLESLLENPTAVERAAEELTEAGAERRAEELAKKLEEEGDSASALLAYELGELYERRLIDEARAVKAYGRSLVLDSSYRPNLWAIRRIFYRRKLWPNLGKLIDAELRYARSEEERADLLLEKARLLAYQLGEWGQARAALEEAVRVAPGQQVPLLELERLVARDGDLPALKEVWEQLGDVAGHPARKVATLVDVARASGAAELSRALSALDAAAAAAVDEADIERVARERVRICEAAGATTELVSAIDKLISALLRAFGPAGVSVPSTAVKRDEPPDRATELRLEIVALRRYQAQLLRREEPQRSWEVLQDALVLAPGEALLLGDLTDLAEELGRFEDLAELVASWQAIEGDPNRGLVLSIRRADALLRGGRRDEAKALLASLDATAPGFIVLTSAAERDALAEKDGAALAAALMRAAQAAQLGTWMGNVAAGAASTAPLAAADPQAAVALYVSAAEVFAYIVGGEAGLADAKAALGKALELRPQDPAAFEASVELCDHQGDVAGALALIDRRLAETRELDGRRALLERATRIAKSHGDLEIALATDRKLLEISPADRSLQWRVEAMLGQLGREVERAELLSTLATEEPDPTRRVMALVAAARLRERLGQIDVATELYRQALGIWPDDIFARESLADLLRAQERWAELVDERRAEARLLPDGPAARRALREAAWVLEHRIGDIPSALAVYIDWSERLTDDRTALEGVARCYARLGDGANEVAIRGRLADLEGSPVVIWEWARSLERAGKIDQAVEAYRLVLDAENAAVQSGEARAGVAAPLAALTLGELAVRKGDPMLEVEAIAALAQRTSSVELGAALAEEAGWRYALVLDDVDRAAQSFSAALETAPGRKGALLGLGLTAAKRNDLVAQGSAFEALAGAVTMPEAAGALHLRAAAMASALNDSALAQRRVTAAWTAAHEDVSALVVAAETWELPDAGSDGAAGSEASEDSGSAGVVDALLARAEVLERRAALADDPPSRAHWELDLAEVLERAGRLREAGDVIVAVLRAAPDDVRALVALRRMSHRGGDKKLWADASYRLARQIAAPAARLALLRDAITLYDGAGAGEPPASLPHALATYRRMFEADAGMPELTRYLELIRQSGDVPGLLAALSVRLNWIDTNEPAEAGIGVLLERATVRFGSNDQLGAITDLDDLLGRDPGHLEALRFRADLALLTGDAPGAAERWRRCLDIETRPERRADIELALARVLSEEMSDVAGAIEQMVRVVAQQPGDLGLRERLFGLYARIADWDHGARELRELIRLRPTAEEKARDEHRLAALLRDKVGDRLGARLALDRGRNLDPLNLDCIRELADLLDPPARQQMLTSAADRLREVIAESPTKAVLYDRLAAVLGWQSDVDGRWLALIALEAVGTPTAEQRQVLSQGRGRAKAGGASPKRLDAQSWVQLTPPMPSASGIELWRAMAAAVTASINLDAQKLGFGRGERVPVKKLAERDRQLAAAFATFGLTDVELFVSDGHDARGQMARVLSTETPTICLGREIAGAATAAARFALGRALALAANGYGTLAEIRDGELERFTVAALRAADAPVPPYLQELVTGEDAALAERTRLMKKHLSRKDRTTIGQLALRGEALADVAGFRRAALGAANRAGLLWCGDLSVALAAIDAGRGGRAVADSPAAIDLVVWSISTHHVTMREELGIGLSGAV